MTRAADTGQPASSYHEASRQAAGASDPRRRFALICHRDDASIEATYWASGAEARQALAELTPCGPRCIGVHTVADIDPPPRHPAGVTLPRNPHVHKASRVGVLDTT